MLQLIQQQKVGIFHACVPCLALTPQRSWLLQGEVAGDGFVSGGDKPSHGDLLLAGMCAWLTSGTLDGEYSTVRRCALSLTHMQQQSNNQEKQVVG